jgi:hypothetical protein
MTDPTITSEPTGWFTITTEDGELQLDAEQFEELIRSGAHRLGLRLVNPERVAVQVLRSSRSQPVLASKMAIPDNSNTGRAA